MTTTDLSREAPSVGIPTLTGPAHAQEDQGSWQAALATGDASCRRDCFAYSGIIDRTDRTTFQESEARIATLAETGADLSLAIEIERIRVLEVQRLGLGTGNLLGLEQAETNERLAVWIAAVQGSLGDINDKQLRVRPYALTGGRVRSTTELALETIVLVTPRGEEGAAGLPIEKREILGLCADPTSVAEVSAHLGLPSVLLAYSRGTWSPRDSLTPMPIRLTEERDPVPTSGSSKGYSMLFKRSEKNDTPSGKVPLPVKIVVAGGYAVGKTTFVGSISEIEPLTTEESLTSHSQGVDIAG